MPISDAVANLEAELEKIKEHLPLLDNANDHVETSKAILKGLEGDRDKALADIRALKAEHERVLAAGQQKMAQQDAELLNQTKIHNDQISALQETHNELDGKVKSLLRQHDQVLASIESLKKKFA